MATPHHKSEALLPLHLHSPKFTGAAVAALVHRINLCDVWGIPLGDRLLDIGCGQGTSTLVLAQHTGPGGHVWGIDPASPDYGGPYTVAQSQAYILASPLKSRISFAHANPLEFLGSISEQSEAAAPSAVLCHCLWYFSTPDTVATLFAKLASARTPRIYFAEWRGVADPDRPEQAPHAHAAAAQMELYRQRPLARRLQPGLQEQNVRGAMLPDALLGVAATHGWRVARRGIIAAPAGLRDGHSEVQYVLSPRFRDAVLAEKHLDTIAQQKLLAHIDRVATAVEAQRQAGRGGVANMDIVWAVLELE